LELFLRKRDGLAVSDFLTLPFAELPQYLQVQSIIVEFLFHCRRICWQR